MDYLRVRNWRGFQHYKDRDPPWIKLHFSLLSSTDWVSLDDASRVLAIACMLVASRNNGCVPVDKSYLRRLAYLSVDPDFKPLIDCGFLEYASNTLADASKMQANASPETEERRDIKPSLEQSASKGNGEQPLKTRARREYERRLEESKANAPRDFVPPTATPQEVQDKRAAALQLAKDILKGKHPQIEEAKGKFDD